MYLKAKHSLHNTTQISSFKYVFMIFLKKSDAKININLCSITDKNKRVEGVNITGASAFKVIKRYIDRLTDNYIEIYNLMFESR